jgi:epsilon-lactone hydrolase
MRGIDRVQPEWSAADYPFRPAIPFRGAVGLHCDTDARSRLWPRQEDATMASTQSGAVTKLYRSWLEIPTRNPEWSLEDQRDMVEGWNVLTREPGGVDYLETAAGGLPAMWAIPKGSLEDCVLLCIHGGGFISGSMYTHRKLFAHVAKAIGVRALIVSYRLLPEGVHPAPLDDVLAAYRSLLDEGIVAERVAFIGDSAGGALALTTQLRARDERLPLPAAAMLLSPWLDMEVTGETMLSNSGKDALFSKPWVEQMAATFVGESDAQDPYASPLYADLTGLPPIYIQVGDYELLLDDGRRLAESAKKAGVDIRIDVFPEQQHTFQMMAGRAPEADDAIHRLAEWARPRLGL